MKKFINISLAAIIAVCLSSCLDKEPSTSLSTDTAIQSVADLETAVNGAYYIATYGSQLSPTAELAIYADELGPDSYVKDGSGQYAQKIHERSVTSNDSYNAYYFLYKGLANVNKCLEAANKLNDVDAAPYIAELYAMRGLFHFQLATLFAPIPTSNNTKNTMGIVLSTQVYNIDYKAGRSTLDETYTQIVKDLTESINSGKNKEKKVGHMNYWAALALRARAYLYWGKYSEALSDAEAVIKDSPYKLLTRDNYVSSWTLNDTDEAIMQYVTTDEYNAQRYAPGYYTSADGYTEYLVTDDFYDFMKGNPNDIRSEMVAIKISSDGTFVGKFPAKYPGKAGASVPTYNNNIKVCRLSEMYLIAAEASLKKTPADLSNACLRLNQLRQNRIDGYVDVATTDIDDLINERRKELFAEGQIAFDYWRNGKTFKSGAREFAPDNDYNVLPIPKEELDINGSILVQNPGY